MASESGKLPPNVPRTLAEVFARAAERGTPQRFACIGLSECEALVTERGTMCERCKVEVPRVHRALRVGDARRSISPDGVLDWCVPGDAGYARATSKAFAAARSKLSEATKSNDQEAMRAGRTAVMLIERAAWRRENGGVLILGSTGIGKSKVLAAVGLRIVNHAASAETIDPVSLSFASNILYVNAMTMARAAKQRRFGEVDRAFQLAESASLLLFDETGFEEDRSDPTLVRDLLRARYEPKHRPTIMASGLSLEALHAHYGEAAIRTVWERGQLIDLHQHAEETRR